MKSANLFQLLHGTVKLLTCVVHLVCHIKCQVWLKFFLVVGGKLRLVISLMHLNLWNNFHWCLCLKHI
ncbi:unnamed protein product [Musa acuminata subsp. malaccensis]|uniref:(wild Malaysian banana) hypothetical protein n=1 Tax=Musa acuminata subsp. malaccensis TaxID=214687 RepID=A0A804JM38_MUSAM|nr:unnamed protein product [Musa acuminata subsp. malaccensis]